MCYTKKRSMRVQAQTCQLKRHPKQRHINTVQIGGPDKTIKMLIDSGADVIGCKNRSNGTLVQDFRAEVGTCSSGSMMATEGMGQLNFELPFGRKIQATEVIFAKELSHNIAGSTVLDIEHGIASFFFGGEVYLVDNRSIGRVPPTWAVLARSKYDPESGLPFVDVQLAAGTVLAAGQVNIVEVRSPGNQPKYGESCHLPQSLTPRFKSLILTQAKCEVTPYPCHEGLDFQEESVPSVTQQRISFEIGLCRTYSKLKGAAGRGQRFHCKFAHCSATTEQRTRSLKLSDYRMFCDACAVGFGESHLHIAGRPLQRPGAPRSTREDKPKDITARDERSGPKPGHSAVTDMFGPTVGTRGGGRYGMVLKDVAPGFRLGVVLPKKSFLKAPLKRMIVEFRARSGNAMRVLKADGDGSYVSDDFKAVLNEMLIHVHFWGPRPQTEWTS